MALRSRLALLTCIVVLCFSFAARADAQQDTVGDRLADAVDIHLDIPYAATDHPRQRLDLYLPKARKSDEPLPVIAFIHGGAWRGGDKRGGVRWVRSYVESGQYAGVSIGYRLSQHARWPAQIHDCKAAIRWIRANAAEHGLDPERIGVIGTSAGGHLVAMLGTSGGVESLEGDLGEYKDQSSGVTCVVDFFGPSDFLTISDYPSQLDHAAPDSPESLLLGGPIKDHIEAAREVSPVTYVSEDDPPFLIVHGSDDQIVPFNQSERMRDALRQNRVQVALITVDGGGHGGFESQLIGERVRAFFDMHLLGQHAELRDEVVATTPPDPTEN